MAWKTIDKALVVGGFRSGKTTWLREFLAKWAAMGFRCLFVDVAWEADERFFKVRTVEQAREAFKNGQKLVAIQPTSTGDALLESVSALAWQLGNVILAFDEFHEFGDAWSRMTENFNKLWRLGHKRGVGIVLASQSVKDFATIVRLVHHVVTFRLDNAVEAKRLEPYLGPFVFELSDFDEMGSPKFPPYWHVRRDPEGIKKYPPLKLSAASYTGGPAYGDKPPQKSDGEAKI